MCLSVCLSFIFFEAFFFLSLLPPFASSLLFIHFFICIISVEHIPFIYQFACPSVCLPVCLHVWLHCCHCLFLCLSTYLTIYLFVGLSVYQIVTGIYSRYRGLAPTTCPSVPPSVPVFTPRPKPEGWTNAKKVRTYG